MIELRFLKEMMLIKKSASKEFDIIGVFLNYSFKFQPNICNRGHNLLIMSINLNDIKY